MSTATSGELHERLSEYLTRAQVGGERITVTHDGEEVAAIISVEDLRLLQSIEDRLDNEEADEALREAEETGFISWEQVQQRHGPHRVES